MLASASIAAGVEGREDVGGASQWDRGALILATMEEEAELIQNTKTCCDKNDIQLDVGCNPGLLAHNILHFALINIKHILAMASCTCIDGHAVVHSQPLHTN